MSNKCNRRRENAQSASSSKAAELLQNSGLSIPFLGIEALNLGGKLSGSDISAIPKDSLTREKAMKELCDYIKPEDELRTIFPYFASNYSKLVTDSTPKIRAYANSLLLTFLKALKNDRKAGKYSWGSSIPFLLLSLNDKCDQVSKLAEALLLECFPEQKRALMLRTYSNDAMILALEVVKLKHKLVQPQQFVEDETDAQRQARLVAQGLETMEMLVQEDYETCKCMCDDFFQSPAVITSLMNSSAMSVRIATLAFFMILSNLDAENVALCRNAFECFIILAGDKRFYETCNIDKAVVPKLLGVVRKKNMHWTVLETSLLPAFALVTNNLGEMDRGKWTCSLIDSFFRGICFANYANDSELITFILTKVLQFIDVILINSKEGLNLLAQVATLVKACLMNKLPASCRLIEKLVDSSDDHQFCSAIAKDEKLPNATVIKILQKHPEILIQEQHLLAIVAKTGGT
uniref:E3 ubiquitin-protein ligase listerin n=1 Tax=Ditylenchus dipsaci TaxID=166011 RepID=A0A915D681_9BILA